MTRRRTAASLLAAALPKPRVEVLDNGLIVALVDRPAAPVVSTALLYRAGRRHDVEGHEGTAHFLEHMMFRGAERFGGGDVDRLTRGAGGSNNAFTSHDATVYEFAFARDRFTLAFEIEADRMRGLRLDGDDIERERQVILEEIAMYRDDPWDALQEAVASALFPSHPYGRPVLGDEAALTRTGASELAAFHHKHYRPANAVLAVAGALGPEVLPRIEETIGIVPDAARPRTRATAARVDIGPPASETLRIERRSGDTSRLMIGLRAPAADDGDLAMVDLLVSVLATGRSSRLHRALVDGDEHCAFVSAQLIETSLAGMLMIAAELFPGSDPKAVEATILDALVALTREPPKAAELRRARRMMVADTVFGHEHIHQQAMTAALAVGLFDAEHPLRQARRALAASPDSLLEAARRWLDPAAGTVIGWSLPRRTAHGPRQGDPATRATRP